MNTKSKYPRPFTVRLETDVAEALLLAAEEAGRPVANLVRHIVTDWVDEWAGAGTGGGTD